MLANIMGVQVDMAHPDMQYRTLKELRANENVFDHLPSDPRATAQKLLWGAMGGKELEDVVIVEPVVMEEIPPEIKGE